MSGRHSRNKGKSGERSAAHALTAATGLAWRRTQQVKGTQDSPDLECLAAPELACEVKRRERLNVAQALERAAAEAGDKLPLVAFRRSREPWMLVLRLSDLPRLLRVLGAIPIASRDCVGKGPEAR